MNETFEGQAAWESRYRAAAGQMWSGKPNQVLVAEVADLVPGRALDVGCGEGADALWLAGRGWRVTGVDISTVALARAAAEGNRQGLDVAWQHVDLRAQPPPTEAFDLVSAHFMQLSEPDRTALYGHLADAVAPGGTLLVVGHHPGGLPPAVGGHRPELLEMLFTPEQLVAQLDPPRWEVVVAETRPRQWTDPDGRAITVGDTVLRARRGRGLAVVDDDCHAVADSGGV